MKTYVMGADNKLRLAGPGDYVACGDGDVGYWPVGPNDRPTMADDDEYATKRAAEIVLYDDTKHALIFKNWTIEHGHDAVLPLDPAVDGKRTLAEIREAVIGELVRFGRERRDAVRRDRARLN